MCIHTQKMNYSIQSLIKYLSCLDCKHHSPTTTHHSAMQFITKGERSSNSCIVDAEGEVLCDTYLAKPQNHRMDKIGRDHQRSSCSAVLRRRAPEKTLFRIVSRQVYKYLQRRFHSITCHPVLSHPHGKKKFFFMFRPQVRILPFPSLFLQQINGLYQVIQTSAERQL